MKKITKAFFVFLLLSMQIGYTFEIAKKEINLPEFKKPEIKKPIVKIPKLKITDFQKPQPGEIKDHRLPDIDIFNRDYGELKTKIKSKFKRKPKPTFPRIPETKQEWNEKAQNIPLEERKLDKYEYPKGDKKVYIPNPKYRFEKYNYPQGKREINLQDIIKDEQVTSYLITDLECKKAAYAKYYYTPDINQISSEFYVEDLDTLKTRTNRILQYNHAQKKRIPIISTGTDIGYKNLFQTLTLVDWDKEGKKLLIKEKTGSMYGGIYKTILYIHFIEDENNESYTIKLVDLDETIKNYFSNYENFQIVNYRYNIEPAGFSADDENIVILYCFAYTKDNEKVFLGTWGYDCITNDVMLLSKEKSSQFYTSANGLILKHVVD